MFNGPFTPFRSLLSRVGRASVGFSSQSEGDTEGSCRGSNKGPSTTRLDCGKESDIRRGDCYVPPESPNTEGWTAPKEGFLGTFFFSPYLRTLFLTGVPRTTTTEMGI